MALFGGLSATVYLSDNFAYADGPLTGQGPWVRGVSSPSADDPSDHIAVEDGAVKFDWTTAAPVNNALRAQWSEDQLTEGMIHAAFDIRVADAPLPADNVRPGFFSFDRSGGSQARGWVGLRAGTESGTYQLGVSASSQLGSNFIFSENDLETGVTYRVNVGYNIATARTDLWIDAEDTSVTPAATATGSTSTGVRRVQLRLYNSDGGEGTTNLGVFYLDNLLVYSGETVDPEPDPDPDPVDLVELPDPKNVFLFLLIGQSNMAGRGAVEAEDLVGDPRIAFYNQNRQWEVARDPLHWDRPGFNGVGPGLSFARTILPLLPPDAVIGLIPAAQGATPIARWEKEYSGSFTYYGGQYLYPHALGRALEAAEVGTLAGILWNQGESDAGSAENDGGALYRTRLHRLINDLRTDLDQPELPFIVSTLGPWRTNAAAINSVFLSLPDEVPFTATVNTLDPEVAPLLVNNPNDTPHYLTPSYRLLGRLYAEAFAPFLPPLPDQAARPVLHIAHEAAGLRLRWNQPPGQKVHVESSDTLTDPWQTLGTFTTGDQPEDFEYTDSESPPDKRRFYRLRIEGDAAP